MRGRHECQGKLGAVHGVPPQDPAPLVLRPAHHRRAGRAWSSGLADLGQGGHLHHCNATVDIDLDDPWSLPRLTFFSLMRGLLAYGLSLVFTLSYGYWAAKDKVAERVLVPLLDILQSLPVLSFLPGVVLLLVSLFPSSNIGLELAAVLMIFTGQVWNMTFSYYHAIKGVPDDMREVASIFRLNSFQRWRWLELPYATMGLVWNSMMSMAGGWFFLMVCETFSLGEGKDFRLPGIGSYMSVAVDQGRGWMHGPGRVRHDHDDRPGARPAPLAARWSSGSSEVPRRRKRGQQDNPHRRGFSIGCGARGCCRR